MMCTGNSVRKNDMWLRFADLLRQLDPCWSQAPAKPWGELWWCRDSDVGAVQAWPALSGANQLCCDKPLLVELPATLFKQPKTWIMIYPPPFPTIPALRPVQCSLIWCSLVLNNDFTCKGVAVWLCCIKSFFNVFQHFTQSQPDQNHLFCFFF